MDNGEIIGALLLWNFWEKEIATGIPGQGYLERIKKFLSTDEVVALTEDELLRKELLSQYFSDILTKDIVERYRVKDVSKLRNLALFYSTNFTRSYSFNKVKKVADFSLSLDSVHRFSHYKVLYFKTT